MSNCVPSCDTKIGHGTFSYRQIKCTTSITLTRVFSRTNAHTPIHYLENSMPNKSTDSSEFSGPEHSEDLTEHSQPSAESQNANSPMGSTSHLEDGVAHSEENEIDELAQIRLKWKSTLQSVPQDGDAWYVVPTQFLDTALYSAQINTISQLRSFVGRLDCSPIINENGSLKEGDEQIFTPIPPELFHNFVSVFGLKGDHVIRNMLVEADGSTVLEKNPPFFIVHTVSDTANAMRAVHHSDRFGEQGRCSFSLSQSKTFEHLVNAIQTCMFKAKRMNIRVWFISSTNVEELPPSIPVSYFINSIEEKKLVAPSVMHTTLRSQGIRSSRIHLVVESINKSSRKFPVDMALSNYNSASFSLASIYKSGGNLGLSNLGNTCYMNSALQCLVHIKEINDYFYFGLHEQELNKSNPLGNNGDVAVALSNLLHKLFDSSSSTLTSVAPREFKYTIGRYSSMFHGYQQQDSQEFLSWLLDALHEDLNRINDKPYLEKPELKDDDIGNPNAILELANTCWNQFKQRNDSIIVDLFTGLYQSTLICPECSKQSVTFDPFNDLTLPLPVNNKWFHTFTIVDLSDSPKGNSIFRVEVELMTSSKYGDLVQYLSDFLEIPQQYLFLFEIFRNYFYKNFQDGDKTNKFLPISDMISESDMVIVYIIPHDPVKDLIVPIVNTVPNEDKSYNFAEPFGIPLFIVLEKGKETTSLGTIRRRIEQAVKILTTSDLESKYEEIKGVTSQKYFPPRDFPLLNSSARPSVTEESDDQYSQDVGYNSDVSLANPSVSAAFGFEIKFYDESTSAKVKSHIRGPRSKLVSQHEANSSAIHISSGRPRFSNLDALATKLPTLKQKYYHYPEYSAKMKENFDAQLDVEKSEMKEREEQITSSSSDKGSSIASERDIESVSSRDDQIADLRISGAETGPPGIIGDDDEVESDSNWDNVVPPFASVDNLGPLSDLDRDIVSEPHSSGDELSPHLIENHPTLVTENTMLVIEWEPAIFDQYFSEKTHQAWVEPVMVSNPRAEESKKLLNRQQSSTISLYDCLRNFSTPEILGEQDLWYCPRCKDHRRATKTIQLWSTGDLLTIHLKRFQSARHFSDKINMVVDFPIEGLDISEFINSESSDPDGKIYDLIAVDNHYGGLGGGHYTASVKNFKDGNWYYFDDSRVTLMSDAKSCVTSAAYLLFYKRRSSTRYVGGSKVDELLMNGRKIFEEKVDRLKRQSSSIMAEIESYNSQVEKHASTDKEKSDNIANFRNDEEEGDLYEDTGENGASKSSQVTRSGSKKSRSPVTDQDMKFEYENQRKQRLISKEADSPRSININAGYSSSLSNLASPVGSSEDDES